jgi:hypothetical protein
VSSSVAPRTFVLRSGGARSSQSRHRASVLQPVGCSFLSVSF